MRTATLTYQGGRLVVVQGIRVADTSDESTLHLFAHSDRVIPLRYFSQCPPMIFAKGDQGPTELRSLGLLTLARDAETGELIATEEQYGDMGVKVLLFIDTYDETDLKARGQYFLPESHDSRLPYACHPTPHGGAAFGLVVFLPGFSCFLRSTSGVVAKLTLSPNDVFSIIPCSREELLMLSMDE